MLVWDHAEWWHFDANLVCFVFFRFWMYRYSWNVQNPKHMPRSEVCGLQLMKYVNHRVLCTLNVVLLSTFMQEIIHLSLRDNFDMYHWSF